MTSYHCDDPSSTDNLRGRDNPAMVQEVDETAFNNQNHTEPSENQDTPPLSQEPDVPLPPRNGNAHTNPEKQNGGRPTSEDIEAMPIIWAGSSKNGSTRNRYLDEKQEFNHFNKDVEDPHKKDVPKSILGLVKLTDDEKRKVKIAFIIFLGLAYAGYFAYAIYYDFENDPALLICTVVVVAYLLFKVFMRKYGDQVDVFWERTEDNKTYLKFSMLSGRIIPLLVIVAILAFSIYDSRHHWPRLRAAGGMVLIYAAAALISRYPTKIHWFTVIRGTAVQLGLGILILRTNPGYETFNWIGEQARRFIAYSDTGAEFVFGETYLDHQMAFQAMPVALFFGAVTNVLYYFGALQLIVKSIGRVIQFVMGTGTIESFVAASNIFFSPTESIIAVKEFLKDMTVAELHSVLCVGFGTISGGVMALYVAFGVSASHIVTASVMSAPAALALSRVLLPELEESKVAKAKDIQFTKPKESNIIEAASNGAQSCIKLVTYILVNLMVFTSLIDFLDHTFAWFGDRVGIDDLTFEVAISHIFSPVAYTLGVPWQDCKVVGELVAKALILNSFFSFIDLGIMINNRKSGAEPTLHSVRSEAIATYAICNFANFGSVGMNLGAMGAIAPERKKDLSKVAMRALIGGSMSSYMTACVAGLLFDESTTS